MTSFIKANPWNRRMRRLVICEEFPGNNCRSDALLGDAQISLMWIYSSWAQTRERRADSQWDPRRNKPQLVLFYEVSGKWIGSWLYLDRNALLCLYDMRSGILMLSASTFEHFGGKHGELWRFDACINYSWQLELVTSLLQLRWPAYISKSFLCLFAWFTFSEQQPVCTQYKANEKFIHACRIHYFKFLYINPH